MNNKLKVKLKKITRKTTPMSFDERIEKLQEIQRGWVNHYRMANIQVKLQDVDAWVRNRLRYCILHHWYRNKVEIMTKGNNMPERVRKNLIRLGISADQAYQWSRSRMGGWRIALKRSFHEHPLFYFVNNVLYWGLPLQSSVLNNVVTFPCSTFTKKSRL